MDYFEEVLLIGQKSLIYQQHQFWAAHQVQFCSQEVQLLQPSRLVQTASIIIFFLKCILSLKICFKVFTVIYFHFKFIAPVDLGSIYRCHLWNLSSVLDRIPADRFWQCQLLSDSQLYTLHHLGLLYHTIS